ncbi:MAG: MFS transporter [Bacillota bacterium]
MRLNYGRTFVLGLGFLGITLSWSIYNSYVPIFLSELLKDAAYRTTLVGLIMTFDNIAAITLQPYFGALSDRTWTRVGRRMPFLLVGVPAAAVFFALIPFARIALAAMIPIIIVMNVAMAAFRAPTVALMPDITPSPLRSKANGIINSYPIVVDMTSKAKTGAYTGLYYFFSALAAIVAPPVFGWFMDILGNRVMFLCAFLSFVAAFAFMLGVRRGEAVTAPQGSVAAKVGA